MLVAPALVLIFPLAALAGDTTGKPATTGQTAFETMKTLAGTWYAAGEDGKPTDQVVSIIKLTAGGSVVHETLFPGQPQEMISIYSVEGPDLVMTHYCMLGNQPRLKADRASSASRLVFEFAGGANLDPAKDKHMHGATLTIVDDNHVELQGVGWDGGGPAKEMCCGLKLVRKP
jgi:hypothetical protein